MKLNLLLCLLLGVQAVFAQKVRTTDETFAVSYMRLPSETLNEEFTTYSRNIVAGSQLASYGVNTQAYTSLIEFHGKKLANEGGHMLLEVTIGNPVITERKVESSTTTTEKDGKKITTTQYQPKLTYGLPISYRLVDYQNLVIVSKDYQTVDNSKVITSFKAESTESAAQKVLTNGLAAGLNSQIKAAMTDIANYISANYGYTTMTLNEKILGIKPDQHSQFAKFEKAVNGVRSAFANVKPGTDITAVRTSIQPHLDYWENTEKAVNVDDSKEVLLKYACLYNLARTYLWLQDVNASKQAYTKLQSVNKKGSEVSQLGEAITFFSGVVERNKDKGLYYAYDVPNNPPPASVKYNFSKAAPAILSTASIDVSSSHELKRGTLVYDGKERQAAFVFPLVKVEGGPRNYKPEDGFKIYEHNGTDFKEVIIPLMLRAEDHFTFDNVKCVLTKQEKGKYLDVREVYYESEKVSFYALNSMNTKPFLPKFRMQKSGTTDTWQPPGLSEAEWKKSLKAYLSDCPGVAAVIDKENINEESFYLNVCEYYTKKCM